MILSPVKTTDLFGAGLIEQEADVLFKRSANAERAQLVEKSEKKRFIQVCILFDSPRSSLFD